MNAKKAKFLRKIAKETTLKNEDKLDTSYVIHEKPNGRGSKVQKIRVSGFCLRGEYKRLKKKFNSMQQIQRIPLSAIRQLIPYV